jgi:hypothetical protein
MKLAILFWKLRYTFRMASWSFLTNHARVLLCIVRDPASRDIAASLGITERSAHGIVTDLGEAGYVIKQKDGRRNRHQIRAHLPLPGSGTREPAIGEVLAILLGGTGGIAGLTGLDAATTTRAGRLRHEHSRNSDPAPGVRHSGHVLASRTPARFSDWALERGGWCGPIHPARQGTDGGPSPRKIATRQLGPAGVAAGTH